MALHQHFFLLFFYTLFQKYRLPFCLLLSFFFFSLYWIFGRLKIHIGRQPWQYATERSATGDRPCNRAGNLQAGLLTSRLHGWTTGSFVNKQTKIGRRRFIFCAIRPSFMSLCVVSIWWDSFWSPFGPVGNFFCPTLSHHNKHCLVCWFPQFTPHCVKNTRQEEGCWTLHTMFFF